MIGPELEKCLISFKNCASRVVSHPQCDKGGEQRNISWLLLHLWLINPVPEQATLVHISNTSHGRWLRFARLSYIPADCAISLVLLFFSLHIGVMAVCQTQSFAEDVSIRLWLTAGRDADVERGAGRNSELSGANRLDSRHSAAVPSGATVSHFGMKEPWLYQGSCASILVYVFDTIGVSVGQDHPTVQDN